MRTMLLAVILLAGVLSMGASPVPNVQVSSDRITVHASQTPLSELLSAIGEQAHVAIVQTPDDSIIRTARVTSSFSDVPLEQGVRRLLQDSNYILEREGTKLKRVFILGAASGRAVAEIEHAETKSAQTAMQPFAVGVPDTNERVEIVSPGAGQELQPVAMPRLNLQSANPEVRLEALAMMNSRSALDAPLEDLRLLVEQDPDPRVRTAAFDLLVRRDTTDEWKRMLSRLAIEPAGSFQAVAAHALERLKRETPDSATVLPQSEQ